MSSDGDRERGQVIAALHHRHDAALGVPVGELDKLLGNPGVVPGFQPELGEGSALCASNPAERISRSGANPSSAGRITSVQPARNCWPPDPGDRGIFTTLPATP